MMRRLTSWMVATPILAYILAALLTVSVVDAFVIAHDAIDARNRTAAAATRRIDRLQNQIAFLETRLRSTAVRDAQERGRLIDAIRALTAQIRQEGGHPVTDEQRPSDHPAPSPSSTTAPSPTPTTQPPSPSPSPSPTCDLNGVLHHPIRCLHL